MILEDVLGDYPTSSVSNALSQIKENDYAIAFASDPRPVYAVGLNFTSNNHTLDSWTVEKLK